jgi:hypothetical protein
LRSASEKFDSFSVNLPDNTLSIGQDREGRHFVGSIGGFHHPVRNEVEGKFILYSHQRGQRKLNVPKVMFQLFSAVANYEKHCRELRQRLVCDLEARCHNRQLAEYQAREVLESHGLPVC